MTPREIEDGWHSLVPPEKADTMSVYENLQGMLIDAIALKRPDAEIGEILRQIAAYEDFDVRR